MEWARETGEKKKCGNCGTAAFPLEHFHLEHFHLEHFVLICNQLYCTQ